MPVTGGSCGTVRPLPVAAHAQFLHWLWQLLQPLAMAGYEYPLSLCWSCVIMIIWPCQWKCPATSSPAGADTAAVLTRMSSLLPLVCMPAGKSNSFISKHNVIHTRCIMRSWMMMVIGTVLMHVVHLPHWLSHFTCHWSRHACCARGQQAVGRCGRLMHNDTRARHGCNYMEGG